MNIFVSAFMRSGSSHIVRSLARLLDHRVSTPQVGFAGEAGTDEHIINYNVLNILHLEGDYVLHHHAKATGNNLRILQTYGYRPVVVLRNVFDSLVSVYEQMEVSPHMTVPGVFRPPWEHMADHERWQWMAENMIPWYYSFFASWNAADIPKHFIYYEDYYKDQLKGMKAMLDFLEVPDALYPSNKEIEDAVRRKDARFNFGTSGRGQLGVPNNIKKLAVRMAHSWGPFGKEIENGILR